MAASVFILVFLPLLILISPTSPSTFTTLPQGSSLSVEKPSDVLLSANGVFAAGFYSVGDNAFCFSIWFAKSSNRTVVWMANREEPVNGRGSKLLLLKNGNLILTDAGRRTIWSAGTASPSPAKLHLQDNGNLVLFVSETKVLWQSFDSPTNTLLAGQFLTKDNALISSRSRTNYSSGFYKLYFDYDNVVRIMFDGPEISSVYWPDPWLRSWDVGRWTYNNTRVAVFDSFGRLNSSDGLNFTSADYGSELQRRLTLDFDGNLRLYSLDETKGSWAVSWQAIPRSCKPHGICGPNSLCMYAPSSGRRCSCLPGFKFKSRSDWSRGCEAELNFTAGSNGTRFVEFTHVECHGGDYNLTINSTYEKCKSICLGLPNKCKGFLLKYNNGVHYCYPKTQLRNGYVAPNFIGTMYLIYPETTIDQHSDQEMELDCSRGAHVQLNRTYQPKHPENGSLKFLLWFAVSVGGVEMTCIFVVWCFLFRSTGENSGATSEGYKPVTNGFRKFSYGELKRATRGFSEEIGRGGTGVVYKGLLSDNRVAAIKRLNEATQGEAEFLAEIGTIGQLNHMNLIDMWGYCAEGKHRLLVYEYMEHGSLAENLGSNTLGWKQRYEIAVGTARGLAYLHEECLEWVLHCDVKPQNILLDSDYHPKVADFGLSKLLARGGVNNSSFSRVRGTRGYMAPEWIFNQPITAKVDVYSYGIVMLEMVTGKSPTNFHGVAEESTEQKWLVTWVREKMNAASWLEEIVDPKIGVDAIELGKMEVLVKVALQCVLEDKLGRPTMRRALEMLLGHDDAMQETLERLSSG